VNATRAIAELTAGRVVAAATETFFGLLADPRRPDAIDAVLDLKRRDPNKGLSLLLPDREAWIEVVEDIPDAARRVAERFWPGPLSIALTARAGVDARLLVAGTIAVRVPGPSAGATITRAFGHPLTATSANLAGSPPLVTAGQVESAFAEAVAEGRLFIAPGHAPGGAPSTLVAVEDGKVRVLRRGAISESALATVVPVIGMC
jgi:L-threonylcarbamoyladenylate synthase